MTPRYDALAHVLSEFSARLSKGRWCRVTKSHVFLHVLCTKKLQWFQKPSSAFLLVHLSNIDFKWDEQTIWEIINIDQDFFY